MLVVVKSSPDTSEGKRGVEIAKDLKADLVLIQNGVYFVGERGMEDFPGKVYALDGDLRLRGVRTDTQDALVRPLEYHAFVDLMVRADKVIGIF